MADVLTKVIEALEADKATCELAPLPEEPKPCRHNNKLGESYAVSGYDYKFCPLCGESL
jgi:hypothetical protein